MPAKRPEPPDYWRKACRQLSQADATMGALIKACKGNYLEGSDSAIETLCRSIIGQQISVQAAASIWNKLEQRCGKVTAHNIAKRRITTLTACGLSRQKAECIKTIAKFFIDRRITRSYWQSMNHDEIRDCLCAIKGIGPWTFEMFAIFHLRSPDILPVRDLGLLKAIQKAYNYKKLPTAKQVERLAKAWTPYRTVATWHLWRSIDPEPVEY